MSIAGVMVVRDEADVLPINIAHHRSIGVGRFWVVDNGSTDGTSELLRSMAREHDWLNWTSEPGPFHQSEFVSHMAREAYRSGAEWILPIDADEFWWTPHRSLGRTLARDGVGAFECRVETFVQARHVTNDQPGSLTTMTYRSRPRGTPEAARYLVETGEIGFVEMVYPPKIAMRASDSLMIQKGNHGASGYAGALQRTAEVVVLHAPIRSRERLAVLAQHGRRVAEVNSDEGTGWHVRRWAAMDADGTLESDWLPNSQQRGRLQVGAGAHRVARDGRLRDAVAPFVSLWRRWAGSLRSTVV